MGNKLSIKIIPRLLVIIFLSSTNLPGSENQTYLPTLDVLKTLVEETVDQVLRVSNLSQDTKVILQSFDDQRTAAFIDVWMADRFRVSGFDSLYVRSKYMRDLSQDTTKFTNSVVINYRVIRFGVDYKGQASFWRDRLITRRVFSDLMVTMFNTNGYIRWSGNVVKDRTDSVPYSFLKTLENENVDFTQSTQPSGSFFKKYLEPLFVLGVTGTVVYLFYALRSK